jgi:hypothetical protein
MMGTQTIISREPFYFTRRVWRFVSGNFMDGQRHGDSTWFRRATDRQDRLNAWTRMSRLRRAFIRDFLALYIPACITLAFVAPDLFWLMLGLTMAYWTARLIMFIDQKLFHHTSGGRVLRMKHMRRIETLPDDVAKLFGGKSDV